MRKLSPAVYARASWGGFLSRFVSSISSAWISFLRVSRGWIGGYAGVGEAVAEFFNLFLAQFLAL